MYAPSLIAGGYDKDCAGYVSEWDDWEGVDYNKLFDIIINLQCDIPFLPYSYIQILNAKMKSKNSEIATLAAEIKSNKEINNPNIVKVVFSNHLAQANRALYFSRTAIPYGKGPIYHHIGIYAYKRSSLETFVNLKPSTLEAREKLEQLRAVEAGMKIDVAMVEDVPNSVDTPDDLSIILKELEHGNFDE